MSIQKKSVSTVVILAVIFVLFLGARNRQNETAKYTHSASDGLPYAERGTFPVGLRDLTTGGEKPLEIRVWYPALEENHLEETMYRYEIKMGAPLGKVTIATYPGQAMEEAAYDLSSGPYPLVILSPGFSFGASTYAWLAEHLASYGFVVIAPEHQEILDPANDLWQAAIHRPQDILSVLAFVEAQVETGGTFEGLIASERVAVLGHSYGGYTALAAAGARINTPAFKAHCEEATASEHPAAWLCDQLVPHLDEMANLAGMDTTPEGLWPAWTDSRVGAIVSLAGDAFFFGQEGLAEINIPVMAIGGTADQDSPYEWGTYPIYEEASSQKKVRISLLEAEHMPFTGSCENIPWYLKLISGEFCADPEWDRNYAHDLTKHFTTAFLLTELKQDAAAPTALTPEGIELPGMKYEALGY